jgi:PilZ domain
MLAKAGASSHSQRSHDRRFGYHFAMDTVAAENLIESHEFCGDELVRRATLERRIFERKSIAIHAQVTLPGMSVLPGHTVDISRAGASITVPFELAHGQQCLIDLQLQACGESSAFHIPGEVRYCVQMAKGRFRVGIRFGEIEPATSALIAAILKAPV